MCVCIFSLQQRSVFYYACLSGSASTAFLLARDSSEAFISEQVAPLYEVLRAAASHAAGASNNPAAVGHALGGGDHAPGGGNDCGGQAGGGGNTEEFLSPTAGGVAGGEVRMLGEWNGVAAPAASVVAVLRVWKTWASSELLVSALASR